MDALILTNPWTGDDADALPPAAAIRQRYLARLRDPASWRRGLNIVSALKGLRKLARTASQDIPDRIAAALARFPGPVTIVLATGDATAIGFRAVFACDTFATVRARASLIEVPTASHSFQHEADAAALETAVLAALTR